MKRYVLAAILFAAFPASGLFAQSMDLKAKIPFDFQIGDKLLPAGEYRVQHVSNLLVLRQEDGDHAAASRLTYPSSRRDIPQKAALQFKRYGNQYFLSNVWTAGERAGLAIPQTKMQQEIARRADTVETAGVDLRSR
jgi:hypothetical protein